MSYLFIREEFQKNLDENFKERKNLEKKLEENFKERKNFEENLKEKNFLKKENSQIKEEVEREINLKHG